MDPRVKLLLTIAYIVMLFVGSNPAGLVISIVFLTVLYLVAKIPLKIVGKSIKPILPIILFTAVLNLFFMTGTSEPLVSWWILKIYTASKASAPGQIGVNELKQVLDIIHSSL